MNEFNRLAEEIGRKNDLAKLLDYRDDLWYDDCDEFELNDFEGEFNDDYCDFDEEDFSC